MNKEERVIELINQLENTFEIRTFLDHDPYKVLVRTILSQRTRDENTDQATNNLFEKYPDIYAVVSTPLSCWVNISSGVISKSFSKGTNAFAS